MLRRRSPKYATLRRQTYGAYKLSMVKLLGPAFQGGRRALTLCRNVAVSRPTSYRPCIGQRIALLLSDSAHLRQISMLAETEGLSTSAMDVQGKSAALTSCRINNRGSGRDKSAPVCRRQNCTRTLSTRTKTDNSRSYKLWPSAVQERNGFILRMIVKICCKCTHSLLRRRSQ